MATGSAEAGGTGGTRAYAAASLPSQVSSPATAKQPGLAYPATVQSDNPLRGATTAFLSAYLTGAAELARYVTPGATVEPVTPPPYESVALKEIKASRELPGNGAMPADGSRVRAHVAIDATDDSKQEWPLSYALTMTVRAGRWEVAAVDPAPAIATETP